MWIGTNDRKKREQFNRMILRHINAAYNLARWLMQNDQDAEDAVQDACVRAFRFYDGHRGVEGRAWLLKIVRNACYTALRQRHTQEAVASLEEAPDFPAVASNPETIVLQRMDIERFHVLLNELPLEFREVVILRDLEGMSYREIGEVVDIPLGTVMSRLARARRKLQQRLMEEGEIPVMSETASRKEVRREL